MDKPTLDQAMEQRMRHLLTLDAGRPPVRRLAVFSTPRSGSSFFCDVLAATGQLGNPLEWFNVRWLAIYRKALGLQKVDMRRYVDWIERRTTSENGVFSVNLQVHQYARMRQSGFDALSIGFDRLVYVHRADKLAQSLSYAKAQATDQWSSDLRARGPQSDVEQISDVTILEQLVNIRRWDDYYLRHLKPLMHHEYLYEDFSATPAAIASVLADFGIQMPPGQPESGFRVQRDRRDLARLDLLRNYILGGPPARVTVR